MSGGSGSGEPIDIASSALSSRSNGPPFTLERVSQPEIEPVTLAEAKRHIRQFVNVTTEDDDVQLLIQVAREWVEDYTGRAMIDQTWRITVNQGLVPASGDSVAAFDPTGWSHFRRRREVLLRRSPVLAITSFVTVDDSGTETPVDSSTYQIREANSKWPRVVPLAGATWIGGSFKIEFRAGFADRLGSPVTGPEVVPAALRHAVKLIIANYDENRGPVAVGTISGALPLGIEWLLAGQKCEMGMA